MEAAAHPDASPRLLGIALSAVALVAGWLLSMPFADRLEGEGSLLALVRFAALLGGLLALIGFAIRIPAVLWLGVGVAALLFLAPRLVWPWLPFPALLAGCAAWWQSRQPRLPAPAPIPLQPMALAAVPLVWQDAPAPVALPKPVRRAP
jgi:hypothetical protein